MLNAVFSYLPVAIAVLCLLSTGALAVWSFRRKHLAWPAFTIASVGAQVASTLQYLSAFVSMAAQAQMTQPTDRRPYSVEVLPTRTLQFVAWLSWALAVVFLARSVRLSESTGAQSWRRPTIGLVLIALAIAMFQRVDDRLDELVAETWRALYDGESRLAFRSVTEPEDVDALASIPARRIELAYVGMGGAGVALDNDGRAFQWDAFAPSKPATLTPLPAPLRAAFVGAWHACGITVDGHASCASLAPWTDAPGVPRSLLDARVSTLVPAVDVADHARICGLLMDGTARCWTSMGPGDIKEQPDLPFGTGIRAMTPEFGYLGCVAGQDGAVRCWMRFNDKLLEGEVTGVEDVVALSSSTELACAIDRQGSVACWAIGVEAVLARGRGGWAALPVSGLRATQISVSIGHACAVTAEGKVTCWGSNRWGELCDGTTEDRTQPVAAVGVSDAVMVATQGQKTCILRSLGVVECCGKQRR